MPSQEEQRISDFLKRNLATFASKLDTRNILSELLSADVLNYDEFDTLGSLRKTGASNRAMTEELWTILRTKSTQDRANFLRCVQQKQAHLVEGISDLLASGSDSSEGGMSGNEQRKPITRRQVLALARGAGSKWKKVARSLPDARRRTDDTALSPERLKAIAKSEDDDEDRFIAAIYEWQAMSSKHTWGPLWRALEETDLGHLAEKVFHGN